MVSLDGPVGERRLFVVEEEATILDGRRRVNVNVVLDVELVSVRDPNVRPPEPRRDSNLLG